MTNELIDKIWPLLEQYNRARLLIQQHEHRSQPVPMELYLTERYYTGKIWGLINNKNTLN